MEIPTTEPLTKKLVLSETRKELARRPRLLACFDNGVNRESIRRCIESAFGPECSRPECVMATSDFSMDWDEFIPVIEEALKHGSHSGN